MATNYPTEAPKLEGLNRGRGVPAFIRCNQGLVVPERYYYREQSPLAEALGCGDNGMAIFGDDEIAERNRALFGFENEDEQGQKLAEIATGILVACGFEEEAGVEDEDDDEDVGMVVTVERSNAQDYGKMIMDILSASSIKELQEVVDVYSDMPVFARGLVEICAKKYPNSGTLRFAS